jgi:hypothetical protein
VLTVCIPKQILSMHVADAHCAATHAAITHPVSADATRSTRYDASKQSKCRYISFMVATSTLT